MDIKVAQIVHLHQVNNVVVHQAGRFGHLPFAGVFPVRPDFRCDKQIIPILAGGNNVAYYDSKRQLVVSDTHRGNIILMEDGLLAPIDLRVQALTDTLIAIVQKLSS